ncbi:hypothetical protein [uncultured Bifidobacterium sp.]|uniref:hypothetical protein n=1 Tax=uncultured Bifidobacterium sp. TaxID=165187 RepID=UPI0025980FEA|nr:hypothetical protein [uncultured Bifidobacterium sp.]
MKIDHHTKQIHYCILQISQNIAGGVKGSGGDTIERVPQEHSLGTQGGMNPCNAGGDLVLATTSPSALDGLFICSVSRLMAKPDQVAKEGIRRTNPV